MPTLIGIALGELEALARRVAERFEGVEVHVVSDHRDVAPLAVSNEKVDIVIIGPGADAVSLVQHVGNRDAVDSLIVLAAPDERDAVHAALKVSPFVPNRTRVLAVSHDDDLDDELTDIIGAAVRRTEHRRVLDSINRTLADTEADKPRAAKYLDVLMRQAPIGILLVDEQGHVVDANEKSRLLFGLDDDAFRAAHVRDLLGADIDGDDPETHFAVERVDASGGEQVLEVRASPVDAQPIAMLVLVHDVTAETMAERARRTFEAQLLFQKSLLEAQSEAAVEGILVVAPDGKILSYNQRFVHMWQIPDDVVESRSDDAALRSVLGMLRDPDAFLERVRYLYAHPLERSRDEIVLLDGRVYDRYSSPIIADDATVHGRVWFFNDVTELRRNEHSLRFAAEAADILAETLDPHVTLTRIARLAVPRLCDWCVIYRKTPDDAIERVAIEYADPAEAAFAKEIERYNVDPHAPAGVSYVIRTGRSLLRPDVTAEELSRDVEGGQDFIELVQALGVVSWMSVPLEARGRVIGAISFVSSHSGRRYTDHDLAIAEDLGHRAGLAMDNAALFDQQRHIARTLQESLLPRELPLIPGLDVAVRYIAAGQGHDVGGDFYDFFLTDDGGCGLVVGDVVGKGPEAAALTALARYTVRAAALEHVDPATVLSVLNQAIHRQHDGSRFCTAVYARMNREGTGVRISLARGGHPPPLVLRASGEIEELAPAGLLLGTFLDAQLQAEDVFLTPGDTLVLYTDGVIEARSDEQAFGESGLTDLLSTCAGLPAEDCAEEITDAVLDLQGGRIGDDIALVVIRVATEADAQARPAGNHRTVDSRWLSPRPESAVQVRRFVRNTLSAMDPDAIETVALVANELAINAIRHAATEYRVRLKARGPRVRVEVRDLSLREPEILSPTVKSLGGRGLHIVRQIASRWGVARREDGKVVWAELNLEA